DAVYSSNAWARRFLSNHEIGRLQQEASSFPPPPAIPPFVQELQEFPYEAGLKFVQALVDRGGEGAVDAAFRNPPVSTEQILHPDTYPSDHPAPVSVAKPAGLSHHSEVIAELAVWGAWVSLLLQLQLPQAQDAEATDFWDGAEYKAWSNGQHTVVVLRTAWDTEGDATEFQAALASFTNGMPAHVTRTGSDVTAVFASDG